MDRPGWKRLERHLDTGKGSTVVCWRLDRLGRTASGLTALLEKVTARKINLVSVRDGIDLSTPTGRLIANVLASVPLTRPKSELNASPPVRPQPVPQESSGAAVRKDDDCQSPTNRSPRFIGWTLMVAVEHRWHGRKAFQGQRSTGS